MSNIEKKSYVAYCRDHAEEINIEGIANTARRLGLEDVNTLFNAVDEYTLDERKKLKDKIKTKLRRVHVDAPAVDTAAKQDVPLSRPEQLTKIIESQDNIRIVDLIANTNELEDVARVTGRTDHDLKLAVQNHKKLLDSLEEKVRVERAREKKNYASSSSQPKPRSNPVTKKGGSDVRVAVFLPLMVRNHDRVCFFVWSRFLPRGSLEEEQFFKLIEDINSVILSVSNDRWIWSLDSSGEFSIKSTRLFIDDHLLLAVGAPTRWVLKVPIKINIMAWKVSLDKLPTRLNLSLRGIEIPSITCPICSCAGESCSHLFFTCSKARNITIKLARWWEFDCQDLFSYDDWLEWFHTLRLIKGFKDILEGVFYVMWWVIWKYRNQTLFGSSQPRMDMLFDEIVLLSFTWCSNRYCTHVDDNGSISVVDDNGSLLDD
ncbi:RNA-directed DNA polymerase, eukaryota [Tanacetum coccineum]